MKKLSKQFLFLVTAGMFFTSCENKNGTKTEASSDTTVNTATAPKMDYPYTIEHPDNWEVGSTNNTMVALNALKAWEEGKMDESVKYFADSVTIRFDGLDKKMSNDSLKAFFTRIWNNSFKIKMQDFESVISKDKSAEWVTLWYRESWEAKGVKDSSDVINNMRLKDRKIILLDNYTRKLH